MSSASERPLGPLFDPEPLFDQFDQFDYFLTHVTVLDYSTQITNLLRPIAGIAHCVRSESCGRLAAGWQCADIRLFRAARGSLVPTYWKQSRSVAAKGFYFCFTDITYLWCSHDAVTEP
jgi:hypothetical protein